jgi:hypothetical protein
MRLKEGLGSGSGCKHGGAQIQLQM